MSAVVASVRACERACVRARVSLGGGGRGVGGEGAENSSALHFDRIIYISSDTDKPTHTQH